MEMNNPKISVIVPVYNVEKYLPECLDSIINQTLKDIEIICLNDGSTDNSLDILKEYALKDSRIKLIDKENEGLGYTRKVGLEHATGDYLLFCDSDDYYAELTAFEELYNYIEKVKVDVVIFESIKYSSSKGFWENKDDHFNNPPQKEVFSYFDLGLEGMLASRAYMWKKIYSKKFFDSYNDWYFPKHMIVQDLPLYFQILMRAKMSYINRNYYVYRTRADSAQNNKNDIKLCNFCQAYKDSYKILKEKFPNVNLSYFVYYGCFKPWLLNDYQIKSIDTVNKLIDIIKTIIKPDILSNIKDRKVFLFFKASFRMSPENYWSYLNKKILKNKSKEIIYRDKIIKNLDDAVKYRDKVIKNLDNAVKYRDDVIKNLDIAVKYRDNKLAIQDQVIKQLQNSWSYRIGRLFTYPLSIPFEFYKYICNYNLLKKSGLFDSEYYLVNNEDVKNAKVDPIKHYLKFGWKEGRNPSTEFDGNEYLNKKPDVKVAGICPLVHYLKFGKNEK